VHNDSTNSIAVHTDITYNVPVLSASFDIDLLNQLLFTLVQASAIRVHLETSADPVNCASRISWSQAFADGLNAQPFYAFHEDDDHEFCGVDLRLKNLDSGALQVFLLSQGTKPVLQATLDFSGGRLVGTTSATPVGDITIQSCQLVVAVDLTMTTGRAVGVTCNATTDPQTVFRKNVADALQARIADSVQKMTVKGKMLTDAETVRPYIDQYIARLLRLGAGAAVVLGYAVDASPARQHLIVSYCLKPTVQVQPPVG